MTWPIFEGGARKRTLEIAKSEHAAAQHELEDSRDKAISQVWQYYSDTKLAIRRLDVAAALLDWGRESGATTITHWFQPLGSTLVRHGMSAQVPCRAPPPRRRRSAGSSRRAVRPAKRMGRRVGGVAALLPFAAAAQYLSPRRVSPVFPFSAGCMAKFVLKMSGWMPPSSRLSLSDGGRSLPAEHCKRCRSRRSRD